jgi:xanthine dehydrogenase accessory factor
MTDYSGIIAKAHEWRGMRLALATVISTWGSAPRPRGSHMLISQDGRFEGSVSGGCVEADVLAAAEGVISSGRAARRRYGVADPEAWQVGLPCGGEIEVLIQPVAEGGFPPALFERVADARARRQKFAVSTDLESGLSWVGEAEGVFVNLYHPARRLLIVGAVNIAQSLVSFGQTLGLQTAVIDPRGRFLTEERFPNTELDDRWPDEAISARAPDSGTAVVTLSHNPRIDDPALLAALAAPTGYIAALGSRRSHAARLDRLALAGADPQSLARIEGPAGLDIGAVTSVEIALSIASGMIASLNDQA